MNLTRREFIASFFGVALATTLGIKDEFQDIQPDWKYIFRGGFYGDNGGYEIYGREAIGAVMNAITRSPGEPEDNITEIGGRGFYLVQIQQDGKTGPIPNNIYFTREWLKEFYHRHKDENSSI